MNVASPHPSLSSYRPDIDGLRAVAVIAVMLYHAWPNYMPGGFIGVDIFFVISGYLITSIILSQLEQGTFSILGFYARRVRRIFPALLLVLAATLLFGWIVLLPGEFRQIGRHVMAGSAFVSNLLLWHESGYFDNSATTKPLLHLWSLGIEEQFYALWPLMLWVTYKRRIGVLVLLGTVFLCSMTANVLVTASNPTAAFYSPATRFWELMTGGIGAYLQLHGRGWPGRSAQAASLAGAALLAAGFLAIRPQDAFPGWWALVPVAGTFLLIMCGPATFVNRHILGMRLAVGIGLISYPLYLWHWPLLSYAYIVIGERPPFLVRVGLIALTFLLAYLSYRLVELPIRQSRLRVRVVRTLAGGMVAALLAGVLVNSGMLRQRIDASGAEPILNALNDSDFPGPTLAPLRYKNSLFQMASSRAPGITVFLGDSVVEQYGPFVERAIAGQPNNFRSVVFATAGNCPPILHTFPLPKIRYSSCPATVANGYAYAQRPDVKAVVVGGAWYGYFQDHGDGLLFDDGHIQLQFPDKRAQEAAYRTLEASLLQLKLHGKQVFLLLQPPMGSSFDPRNMITGSRFASIRPRARIEPVKLDRFLDDNAAVHERLVQIAHDAGVELIDPAAFLCQQNLCPVLGPDGAPVYTDTMHMRPAYSRSAATYLTPTMSVRAGARTISMAGP